MLKEFKVFITRGNVIELALAVVIGGAFGRIVTSFVNDVLMPFLGVFLSYINISDLKYIIRSASEDSSEIALTYGLFLQAIIDFLIIAAVIFLAMRTINRMQKAKEVEPEQPPKPPKEELLLEEIRDILKSK